MPTFLSKNSNAIHILEKNIDKVDWTQISVNPSIFTYNYKALLERIKNLGIAEELTTKIFNKNKLV